MSISYQHAIKAIDASIEKATALGVAVSLAVVDINGYLVAFARLDRNGDMIDFAVKKAKTALLFEEVDDRLEIMAVRTSNYGQRMFGFTKNMLAIGGTAPIKDLQGRVIGVIASSGGSPDQDMDIVGAGARAVFECGQKCGHEH
ncbi:heme-binding protein [Pedobacter sp. UC225_65]|uniref:GlcG/HbpS family heme-binding protein n=1 Tax=Pedobacter sp. UC225_65 TaxID=3350173 RepID=UPI00366DB9CA